MDIKVIIGVALFLMIGVMFYPAIASTISDAEIFGSVSEYMSLTANVPHATSYAPIYSFTSLVRSNVSSASNTAAGNMDDELLKSLSTNNAVHFEEANLTIECDYEGSEEINVSLGSHLLGMIDLLDVCPRTFASIDQSWIGDPSTILEFNNGGSSQMEIGQNTTVTLINDTAYIYFYTINEGDADDDLHVNVTFQRPVGEVDLIEVSFNGFNYVNATGNVFTTGLPVGLMYANGSQQMKFLDLNGTSFDGDNVTAVQWSFTYFDYVSNFTNATLSYDRWSAYPASNYTVDLAGTISANHSGIYEATYIHGSASDKGNLNLINLVPILFIGFLIVVGIRELRKR